MQEIVNRVQILLDDKKEEWNKLYKGHAEKIFNNIENIKKCKMNFNVWKPLYLYLNISNSEKSSPEFSLRYRGKNVASLSIKGIDVIISTSKYIRTNKDLFDCDIELSNANWNSIKAKEFRKHYSMNLDSNPNFKKQYNEHRIESLLLTEFSKNKCSKKRQCKKIIKNIQPVKLAGIARFQMPTPISASKKIDYSCIVRGGSIDILARVGTGPNTKLCIMEIKDEYKHKDDPIKALKQGLAYAVFIRELIRSDSGEKWWKLFGFNHPVPKKLKLYVSCVMPFNDKLINDDKPFSSDTINMKDSDDTIQLHYIYFEYKNDEISIIDKSF